MADPIEDFEVLLNNESSDSKALPHLGMSFREETKAFAACNDRLAQLTSRIRIASGD